MRATTLTVAALSAALLLTACSSGGDGDSDQDRKAAASCVDELAVEFGPANAAPAAGDTGNVPVTVTNRGGAECALDGLPAVEFDAGAASTAVAPDQAAPSGKTELAKGASTSFTLTYVRGEEGGGKSLVAQKAKVTLPGSTKGHSFKWSYGAVALKSDGKTPDASVSGFQRSGD
ncbi:DUF4232 domain-containing protein [Streptomyces sp. uw30]|uniref:DUF4232 domain-containing protein n=1 Tax=Streptomyces sp. uw30 TaxID=1828179 RepID=UPI0011CDB2A6|nr:DUF4232 domain-containing protein [Streptomyces sp. uw30]TXS50340.1 DUF4232 domain-containing protein [Streptomyces sp. uw30]